MRRFERRRVERLRRRVAMVGVSFALGALVASSLTWRLHEPVLEFSNAEPPRDVAVEDPAAAEGGPVAVATSGSGDGDLVETLRERDLVIPVQGIEADDLRDTYADARGSRVHEAIDIIAPRDTPVLAVDAGRIQKLFTSKAGGLTVYQFDADGRLCYYYAHLDRYADGLREGQTVRAGDVIGYVGSTGNASPDAPHLHFAIFRLTPERLWWKGDPINPYPVLK